VASLRKATGSKEKQDLKKQLPAICFSGEFKHRSDNGLLKHSGLVCIDFDHLGDRLIAFKDKLCKDPYTHIAFISPSGDGLKVVIKIPPQADTHAASCRAISKYYEEESLDEFEDVSRVCFESYDPTIYYNKDSDIFIKIIEEKIEKRSEYVDRIDEDVDVFERMEKWYNDKGEYYENNNKHKFLVKMAAAANWIGMDSSTTAKLLVYKYRTAADPVPASDIVKIVNDVFRLYKTNHGMARLEGGKFIIKETKKIVERELLEFAIEDRDVIKLDDVRESMVKSFLSGRTQGASTHFVNIDNHFRWKKGELTLMHGIMNHGKSIMMMQMCLIRSVFNNEKWAFFSPEQNPPDDFYDDLVHMYIGQNTQKFYSNQMTLEDYNRGMDFVKDYFYYIYPESESPTPDYINLRFQEVINKYKVDGCVIDPYNQLDNDIRKTGGREDLYLSTFLTKQKRFALNNNIYMVIIAHPRGSLSKTGRGDYEMPNVYDLSGGAMWGNKCDNVLCAYRPYYTSDKTNTLTIFASQKIKKQKLNGIPGDVELTFDIRSMRYNEKLNETDGFSYNPLKI
jgi:twinkle protein